MSSIGLIADAGRSRPNRRDRASRVAHLRRAWMNEHRVLYLALAIFVCRAVIAAFVIPPWQGPDEPLHYVLAEQVARGTIDDQSVRARLEAQVLRSMAANNW